MTFAAPRPPLLRFVLCLLVTLGVPASFVRAADQASVTARVDPAAVRPGESATLEVAVEVDDGFHAQSHTPSEPTYIPLTVTVDPGPSAEAGAPEYPAGENESYPGLGTLNVYTGTVTVRVPIKIKADAPAGPLTIHGVLRYQACNDVACFPPKKPKFEAVVTVGTSSTPGASTPGASTPGASTPGASTSAAATAPSTSPSTGVSPPAAASAAPSGGDADAAPAPTVFGLRLADNAYVLAFAAAFVAGIIFNAVPCVLPVVPLKIAGFYEAAQHDRRRCVLLGLAFSVGLVASFAVLAVLVVGLRALTWGGLFQQTWFTVTIVVVLTLMAASQFGLFTIQLPTSAYAFTPRHDTLVGNALFGVLTAALSTPCTIGPFSVLLVWALKQPPALGATVVVVVGCGMAAPYLVLSAFPQVVRRFPRTGPVGEIIKQTLAFFVLATAFYFARPLLGSAVPPRAFWWTLFAVVAIAGAFLVVRTVRSVGTARAVRVSAVVAALLVGGWGVVTVYLTRSPYDWTPYSEAAVADATRAGRPVLIDFTADWCGNCQVLEAFVINDPKVARAVRAADVVMLKADVTNGTEAGVPLKDKLIPTGEIPLTVVYAPGRPEPRLLSGVYGTAQLLDALAARP